ncbi:transposase [Actinoplanes sp. URMC 104]|uniref:transposase n=1 Tax=Actinoplanes sp. URMC 104 TaxID=3423409 RepID=UPI003F1D296B
MDDFAVERGHHYGTVLIDCGTRKVVDVLIGRDAQPLTAWLRGHDRSPLCHSWMPPLATGPAADSCLCPSRARSDAARGTDVS